MANVTESTHKLEDGHEVFTKTWKVADADEKARMLFLHGFSDHSGNYDKLFPYLNTRGITVYCFDQRGWGRSALKQKQKGMTGLTPTVLGDISSVLRPILASASAKKVPVFIAGQSMGGAESLAYAVVDPDNLLSQVRGTLSVAPLIALHPSTRPFSVTVSLGRLVGKLLPHHQMVNKLNPKFLSHDPAENQKWVDDPLCHDTATLEGLDGMLDRAAKLETGEWVLGEGKHEGGKSRVIVLHGDADEVNDYQASKDWVDRLQVADKKLFTLPGMYHVLHVEPEGYETLRKEMADWILERSKPL